MKKQTNIISIFLICLLALSSIPMIFGNYASAYPGTCAANFLPGFYVDGLDTAKEDQLSRATADYITQVLNSKYPIFDRRDSDCKPSNFNSIITALQSYDTAVVHSKGHMDWLTCAQGYQHIGLSMYNLTDPHTPTDSVWDSEIYQRTTSKNIVHSFIWHCQTAIIPPGTNPGTCGQRGLPMAFTNDPNIPWWGTSGNQVYLGWNNAKDIPVYNITSGQYYNVTVKPNNTTVGSPQYEWRINPSYDHSDVAKLYYQRLSQGDTTAEALVYMANKIYGKPMSQTPLKDWLVVYGNMNLVLPMFASSHYVSSIAPGSPTNIGSGYVSNAYGITGSAPDSNLAYISGINTGAGGHIVGVLNGVAKGEIQVYAASVHGYTTRLQVFVSNDNVNWVSMGSRTVTGGSGWQWVNFGTYNSNFQYIGVAAMNQYGYEPANIYIDAVGVRP